MEKIQSFTLERHKGPYESWPRRTRLFFNDKDTGKTVPGYVVEGQYTAGDLYLLITSQDCPFEESNDFILLNGSFEIVARDALVPWWFNTYLINTHWPTSDRAIRIHYHDGAIYDLRIEEISVFGIKTFKLKLKRTDDYVDDRKSQDVIVDLQTRLIKTRAAAAQSVLKLADAPTWELWQSTWRNLGATEVDEDVFRRLIVEYTKYERSYHTYNHIVDCFEKFAKVSHMAKHADEIRMALWFHDAVYDSKRSDNELKSAELARDISLKSGASKDVSSRIYDLVLATRHNVTPEDDDQKLLVDVDLSILGADPRVFDEYERQIGWEYRWVPKPIFSRRRREILRQFLSRPRIFSTKSFQDEFEEKARQNLERAISKIDSIRSKRSVHRYAFPLFVAVVIVMVFLLGYFQLRLF